MPYLTFQEYKAFGFTELDETEFDSLINRAGDAVDIVTRHFYKFNDIDGDVDFRREQFKKAVATQIEYFHDMGATSSHGMSEPSTVQIGRTNVSKGSRDSSGQDEPQNKVVSDDVYMYLNGTGLLYKGIGVM